MNNNHLENKSVVGIMSTKIYWIIGGTLFLFVFVYITGIYTYFLRTEVQEEMPALRNASLGFPRILASGLFGEIDFIHKGSGTAKLLEVDGKRVVRFENFSVTSGPDLYVYLSRSNAPGKDLKSLGEYIDLGPLKGTMGNQNYEVPQNREGYSTVVIWCKRFGVLFSYAVMK